MQFIFTYIGDNESIAIEEIKKDINKCGLNINDVNILEVNKQDNCPYGKILTESQINNLNPEDEEVWFDEYEFIVSVDIKDSYREEILLQILSIQSIYFSGFTFEEYKEEQEIKELI